jgi:hypothetical protein
MGSLVSFTKESFMSILWRNKMKRAKDILIVLFLSLGFFGYTCEEHTECCKRAKMMGINEKHCSSNVGINTVDRMYHKYLGELEEDPVVAGDLLECLNALAIKKAELEVCEAKKNSCKVPPRTGTGVSESGTGTWWKK